MAGRIHSYKELRVYQHAMDLAMEIFHLTKSFPGEEKYSLIDQILGQIVRMIDDADKWLIKPRQ